MNFQMKRLDSVQWKSSLNQHKIIIFSLADWVCNKRFYQLCPGSLNLIALIDLKFLKGANYRKGLFVIILHNRWTVQLQYKQNAYKPTVTVDLENRLETKNEDSRILIDGRILLELSK